MPSSVVASFTYNTDKETMRVVFVSGNVYDYLHVPESIYQEMKAASSKGIYLNEIIKPNYEFERVE